MAYTGRDWDNTGTKVTKEDFKRMEAGIKNNDKAITEQATKIKEHDDQINVLNNRTLAPALSNVIPDALYIGDEWTGISCVRTDHGTVNAPPNCLIGVRTMKKLNDDNVIVNIENTQNGEKWTNTWNGSTWLGWQQIATTIVAIPTPLNDNFDLIDGEYVPKQIDICPEPTDKERITKLEEEKSILAENVYQLASIMEIMLGGSEDGQTEATTTDTAN